MMKRNDGFTLIELIVSVAIGSLITLAATTTLLLGLRINAQTRDNIRHQNTTTTLFQLVQKVSENTKVSVNETTKSISTDGKDLVVYNGTTIYLRSVETNPETNTEEQVDVPFMENVQSFEPDMNETTDLLTIKIKVGESLEKSIEYTSSVYCRLNDVPEQGGSTQ